MSELNWSKIKGFINIQGKVFENLPTYFLAANNMPKIFISIKLHTCEFFFLS